MRQLKLPFEEWTELRIFCPESPADPIDALPLHPVAIEMAALLADELGIPFGNGGNDIQERGCCRFLDR
jgi:hypothetical protein